MKAVIRLIILVVAFVVFFPSCATLTLKNNYDILFESNVENAKLQVSESVYDLPANVKVKRSKEDLKVALLADTLQKDFVLKSGKNLNFAYGNLLWLIYAPIGYGMDLLSEKGFHYGNDILLGKQLDQNRFALIFLKNIRQTKGRLI